MAAMWRYRMRWSGFAGGPGVSTLYGSDVAGTVQDHVNAVHTLFRNVFAPTGTVTNLPAGVRIVGDPFVDVIDPATGDQTGTIAVTANPEIVGIGPEPWSDVSGFSITWVTAAFINGRRLRGRTYFVPCGGAVYQTDGTLGTTFLTGVQAAITTYIAAASEPVVWHRPTTPGGSDGSDSSIATGKVIDHPSILTSRRA